MGCGGDKTVPNYFHQTWQQLTRVASAYRYLSQWKRAQNNEGLLNLPGNTSAGKGDYLQIWRGIGGRIIGRYIGGKGVQMHLPKLVPTGFTKRNHQASAVWQQTQSHNQPVVVLISSLTAWQNWQQLTRHWNGCQLLLFGIVVAYCTANVITAGQS